MYITPCCGRQWPAPLAVPCLPLQNVILRRSTAAQPLQPTNLQHTAVTAAGLEKLAFIADEMAGGAWHTKQSRAQHSRHCRAGWPSGAACAKWSQLPLAGLHAVAPVLLLPRGCRCSQSRQTGCLALRNGLRSSLLGGLLLLLLVLEAAGEARSSVQKARSGRGRWCRVKSRGPCRSNPHPL